MEAHEASGTDLGTSWQASNFDDAAWLTGPALLYNENEGSLETFRPYAAPDAGWFERAAVQLADRTRC